MGYFKSHGYDVIDEWSEHANVIDPDDDRLEGRCGRHASSQDSAGPRPAEFDGNSQIPVPQPGRHLSSRHAGPCKVRARRTATSATAACELRMPSG